VRLYSTHIRPHRSYGSLETAVPDYFVVHDVDLLQEFGRVRFGEGKDYAAEVESFRSADMYGILFSVLSDNSLRVPMRTSCGSGPDPTMFGVFIPPRFAVGLIELRDLHPVDQRDSAHADSLRCILDIAVRHSHPTRTAGCLLSTSWNAPASPTANQRGMNWRATGTQLISYCCSETASRAPNLFVTVIQGLGTGVPIDPNFTNHRQWP
jgi:hypothetical protein